MSLSINDLGKGGHSYQYCPQFMLTLPSKTEALIKKKSKKGKNLSLFPRSSTYCISGRYLLFFVTMMWNFSHHSLFNTQLPHPFHLYKQQLRIKIQLS